MTVYVYHNQSKNAIIETVSFILCVWLDQVPIELLNKMLMLC